MEPLPTPPTNKKNSNGFIAAIGGIVGGTVGAVKMGRRRFMGGVIGGVLGALSAIGVGSLVGRGQQDQPVLPPALPPLPPTPAPTPPSPLALASVPQLLDLLVESNHLSAEKKDTLLGAIKAGRSGFVGNMAVEDGLISASVRDDTIATQGLRKTEAAVLDIQRIVHDGPAPAPAWLKANWGNNGINPSAEKDNGAAGISAAANIAQNLVMIANSNPQLASSLSAGVLAATNLARGIAYGDSERVPLQKMHTTWQKTMNDALQLAEQSGGANPVDANGARISMDAFIAARTGEINHAIAATLAKGKDRSSPTP